MLEFNQQHIGLSTKGKGYGSTKSTPTYNFPAFLVHIAPTEPKKEFRFEFNKAALALIGHGEGENHFAFYGGYIEQGRLFIMRVNSNVSNTIKIRNNGTFSNKKDHQFLTEKLDWLDPTKLNICQLTPVENQEDVWEVTLYVEEEEGRNEPVEPATEDQPFLEVTENEPENELEEVQEERADSQIDEYVNQNNEW